MFLNSQGCRAGYDFTFDLRAEASHLTKLCSCFSVCQQGCSAHSFRQQSYYGGLRELPLHWVIPTSPWWRSYYLIWRRNSIVRHLRPTLFVFRNQMEPTQSYWPWRAICFCLGYKWSWAARLSSRIRSPSRLNSLRSFGRSTKCFIAHLASDLRWS